MNDFPYPDECNTAWPEMDIRKIIELSEADKTKEIDELVNRRHNILINPNYDKCGATKEQDIKRIDKIISYLKERQER